MTPAVAATAGIALRSRPTMVVDLEAVRANARQFAARIPGELMAVVKADGFGHGAVEVGYAALDGGATWLGVTSVDEALALRDAGHDAPILSWLNAVDADFETAIGRGVDLAVSADEHLDAVALAAARAGRRGRVHLHIDCGMARGGAAPEQWGRLCAGVAALQAGGLIEAVGVMGHLGCADNPADPHNASGRAAFERAVAVARRHGLRPAVRHLAATAATLTDPRTHHTLSRVGAGLVGIDPSRSTRLHPALTLTAPVVSVHEAPAGTPVGYGHTHVTGSRTTLAILPVGYADGLPRVTSNRGWVWLRGRRRPLVGQVSMDQVVVDAGDEPVRLGELAMVFGPGDRGEPTVAEWAAWAGTIEHEIVTGIGPRVVREIADRLAASSTVH